MTKSQKSPPRKFRRRAEARPDEVLDAALDIFIAKGFAAARVEDIARAAGLSKGAVYLYFPSKVAILEALVRRAIVPLVQHAGALALTRESDPRQALILVLSFIARSLAEPRNAAIPRLILSEAGTFPELAAMYRREVVDPGLAVLAGLISRGIETGVFRAVDPALAVRNAIGPLIVNALMAQIFGFDPPDPERFIKAHIDVLLNGLAARPEGL